MDIFEPEGYTVRSSKFHTKRDSAMDIDDLIEDEKDEKDERYK